MDGLSQSQTIVMIGTSLGIEPGQDRALAAVSQAAREGSQEDHQIMKKKKERPIDQIK
jgi:hypothetical protein